MKNSPKLYLERTAGCGQGLWLCQTAGLQPQSPETGVEGGCGGVQPCTPKPRGANIDKAAEGTRTSQSGHQSSGRADSCLCLSPEQSGSLHQMPPNTSLSSPTSGSAPVRPSQVAASPLGEGDAGQGTRPTRRAGEPKVGVGLPGGEALPARHDLSLGEAARPPPVPGGPGGRDSPCPPGPALSHRPPRSPAPGRPAR